MNTFLIKAAIKGRPTEVLVGEPAQWDVPEFFITVNDAVVQETFRLYLCEGLWQTSPLADHLLLEPLEIERIGLEVAKSWRVRLADTLDLFDRLF